MNTHNLVRTVRPDLVASLASMTFPFLLLVAAVVALHIYLAEYAKFSLAALGVWVVYRGFRLLVEWASAKYQIFDDVVVASFGIVSRRFTQVRVADIRGMSVNQSLVGRFLGVGNVTIGTAATGDAEIVMRGVRDPSGIVATIDGLR